MHFPVTLSTKLYIGGLEMNGEALVNTFEKQTLRESNDRARMDFGVGIGWVVSVFWVLFSKKSTINKK